MRRRRGEGARSWRWLDLGLVFVPAAVVGGILQLPAALVFALAVFGIVPAAGLIGRATEVLAERAGGAKGALLNATFGNITELLVAFLLVANGEVALVKATLVGSIVSNMLLVLGASMLVGGWNRLEQRLHWRRANVQATMMLVAVGTLILPTVYGSANDSSSSLRLTELSVVPAAVLIALYIAGMVFTYKTHRSLFRPEKDPTNEEDEEADGGGGESGGNAERLPRWSVKQAVLVLAIGTAAAGIAAEFLADSVEQAGPQLGLSMGFLGLVVIPIADNAAEHYSALALARGDRLDVASGIAIGSSLQIIMLVIPLLVFGGLVTGNLVTLVFTPLELAALAVAALLVHHVVNDARGNALEGGQLVGLYAVFGAAAFFTHL